MSQQFQFRNSILCIREQVWVPEDNPLQHLLPPDSALPLQHRDHSYKETIEKKNSEIEALKNKNTELFDIISLKQNEKLRMQKKYEELMMMYEQIKQNGATISMEAHLRSLENENKVLVDRVRHLERQLVDSQNDLIKRVKFYQQKNEDSRRLLEKLNMNITKREEKFKVQLHQLQQELEQKNSQIDRMDLQYRSLLESFHEKEDQLTKIMQETERDRSAFSENLSTMETRLHTENARLRQELAQQTAIIEQLKNQQDHNKMKTSKSIRDLELEKSRAFQQNDHLRAQIQQLGNENSHLQIEWKGLQGKIRLLQVDYSSLNDQLRIKSDEAREASYRIKQLEKQINSLNKQISSQGRQIEKLSQTNHTLSIQNSEKNIQVQKYKELIDKNNQLAFKLQTENIQYKNKIQAQIQELIIAEKKVSSLMDSQNKLETKIISLEELLRNYKKEKVKIRNQMDLKWNDMVAFYETEIQKLEARLSADSAVKVLKKSETSYFKHYHSSLD